VRGVLLRPQPPTRSKLAYPVGARKPRALEAGDVRGADCWHLATALYVAPEPSELAFLTLDLAQRKVVRALGFQV